MKHPEGEVSLDPDRIESMMGLERREIGGGSILYRIASHEDTCPLYIAKK